jgi:IS6 family transposase
MTTAQRLLGNVARLTCTLLILPHAQVLLATCILRICRYVNNTVEQDHAEIKRLGRPSLGFGSCPTGWQTLRGCEAMHMLRKSQFRGAAKGHAL